jgi:hypothetical protein
VCSAMGTYARGGFAMLAPKKPRSLLTLAEKIGDLPLGLTGPPRQR